MEDEHFISKLEKRHKRKSFKRRFKKKLGKLLNTKNLIFMFVAVILGYVVGKWLLDYLLSLE